LLLALVVMAASACQMQVAIGVDVEEDGSGVVNVGVGLDDDAVTKLGGADNLLQLVKVADLQASGWTVTGPAKEDDGFTWLRASKPFESAEEATAVLAEVSAGPFRDFSLVRTRSYARTEFGFDGTVDLTGGLEAFGDPELTMALDGKPLGQDIASLEAQFGGRLDELIQVQVAVRLPGDVESNAAAERSDGAVWAPTLSEPGPIELHATSQSWNRSTLLWTAVAAVAAALFVLYALALTYVGIRRRVRRRRRPA
jgi:hypothetical protein